MQLAEQYEQEDSRRDCLEGVRDLHYCIFYRTVCVGSAVAIDGPVLTLKTDQMTVKIQSYILQILLIFNIIYNFILQYTSCFILFCGKLEDVCQP